MPRFRKKFKGKYKPRRVDSGADARDMAKEKEDRGLRSSSLSYKDNIDSV